MTSVVIWRHRELMDGEALREAWGDDPAIAPATPWMHVGDLWLAADSRISTATNSGSRVTPTDAALKILPINLELFRRYPDDAPGSVPVYQGQFAFAYAGGVLPATMTYAMAVSYMNGLTGPADADLPTIGNIVGMINRIGTTYAHETRQPFEAFVVGRCPLHHRDRRDHAYHLRFDATAKARRPTLLGLDAGGTFALLGSHQKAIRARLDRELADDVEYNPALAIKQVIEEQIAGDIGGYLHLARFNGGVEIYPEWRDPQGRLPSPYADARIGGLGRWRVNGIFGR